jgi:CRP-like cAMP-binding protein
MDKTNCIVCRVKSPAAAILNEKELEVMGSNCSVVKFEKGETIFKQGTLSSSIVYIKKGLVKIHLRGPSREKILRIIKAPAYLGIPTTFGDKIYHYSATAIDSTQVCFIAGDTFRSFLHDNAQFAYEIIVDLCRNELSDYDRFVNLSQKQVPGRVAETLLSFAKDIFQQKTFDLPLSRSELGALVGTSRESISRIFTEFSDEKIIRLQGKEITILNETLLEHISSKG